MDMETEFELMDSQCINHPKGVALAGDIPVLPWRPVRARPDRFSAVYKMPEHEKELIAERVWRCLGPGPFPVTDRMEPLPPMNEVMADCIRRDPIGHRWGRGAHWLLVLAVAHRRERTSAMRQKRNQKQYQKRMEKKQKPLRWRKARAGQLDLRENVPRAREKEDGQAQGGADIHGHFQCLASLRHELRELARQLALAHIRLAVIKQQRWHELLS